MLRFSSNPLFLCPLEYHQPENSVSYNNYNLNVCILMANAKLPYGTKTV